MQVMIPGLLPPLAGQAAMLPILQQAWLSRAATSAHNNFIQSMANGGGGLPPSTPYPPLGGFPGFPHHPFFLPPPPPATTSPSSADHHLRLTPPELIKTEPKQVRHRGEEEENSDSAAEDLSFPLKRFRHSVGSGGGEVICPICSIAVRWADLPEHFETELRCLDNIRSLSPIVYSNGGGPTTTTAGVGGRPASNSSQRSAYSTSPIHHNNNNKSSSSLSSSSLSPASPSSHHQQHGLTSSSSSSYLENRWERFERIRNKRRERIGVVRHHQQHHISQQQQLKAAQQQRPRVHTVASMVAGRSAEDSHENEAMEDEEEDIDIGEEDSLSDCGSSGGAAAEDVSAAQLKSTATESPTTPSSSFGPVQYTEADVLRSLNSDDNKKDDEDDVQNGQKSPRDEGPASVGLRCPACSLTMHVPVLNVACWHLKCERCWLRAAGTRQACTICHAAVTVRDLRRVQI